MVMTYHGQIGQDMWAIERVFSGKRDGYFVDLGAFDGVRFSNTLTLERDYNWSGVGVEAIPSAATALRANRRCKVIEAVAAGEDGERKFIAGRGMLSYALDAGDDGQAVASISVPAMSLKSILRAAEAPPVIDFLSCDIEGSEKEVFATFDFGAYQFGAMAIEMHLRTSGGERELLKSIEKAGYVRTATFFSDWFFRPASSATKDCDQDWFDNVAARAIEPAYRVKPEMAHIQWVKDWKRENGVK